MSNSASGVRSEIFLILHAGLVDYPVGAHLPRAGSGVLRVDRPQACLCDDKVVSLLDKIPNSGHGIAGLRAGRSAALETHLIGITKPFMAGRRLKQYNRGIHASRASTRDHGFAPSR
ncbi:MAG TPA: hypothetical protein VMM15_19060, partial [Bradyrhizobium sp.]|nr:hypothetical protein [Bradyrhizobium sp.]